MTTCLMKKKNDRELVKPETTTCFRAVIIAVWASVEIDTSTEQNGIQNRCHCMNELACDKVIF